MISVRGEPRRDTCIYTHVHDMRSERDSHFGETHTYPTKFTIDLSRRDQLVIKLDAEQPSVRTR